MKFYGFNEYLKNNNLKFFYDSLALEATRISFDDYYEELDENVFIPSDGSENGNLLSFNLLSDKKLIQRMYITYCKYNNLAHDSFYKDMTVAEYNEKYNKELIFRFKDYLKQENLLINDMKIDDEEYTFLYRERYIEYCMLNGFLREYI